MRAIYKALAIFTDGAGSSHKGIMYIEPSSGQPIDFSLLDWEKLNEELLWKSNLNDLFVTGLIPMSFTDFRKDAQDEHNGQLTIINAHDNIYQITA